MRRSRLINLAVAAAVSFPCLVFAAAPASADDVAPCQVSASLPAKVAYTSFQVAVHPTFSDPAGCVDWAHYQLEREDAAISAGIMFEHGKPAPTLTMGSNSDGPGRFHLVFDEGYSTTPTDEYGSTAPLQGTGSDWIVAKYASHVKWSALKRDGKSVVATGTVTSWGKSHFEFEPFKKATVDLQVRHGSTWATVKTAKTNSKGVVALTAKAGKGVWRLNVRESATVWDAASSSRSK